MSADRKTDRGSLSLPNGGEPRSSAETVSILAKYYSFPENAFELEAVADISVPAENGAAISAYVGVCQYLKLLSDLKGIPKSVSDGILKRWQSEFASGFLDSMKSRDILEKAVRFIDSERVTAKLPSTEDKPGKYYDNIYRDREAMFRHSPYALEEKLTKAVVRGDKKAALLALREIREQGDKAVVAKDPLRSAKNSMIGSVAFLARATIQAGVNPDSAFALSDSLIRQVEDMNSKTAVLAFEEAILLHFIDSVNERLEGAYSIPVTKAIHYIENRLTKRILLSDVAVYAGVHPAYLSGRFRAETGSTFSGFVTQRKIQESSYFVKHTKYSISDIAVMYGYSSQSHYITSFRRVMGMTPMEFRRMFLTE